MTIIVDVPDSSTRRASHARSGRSRIDSVLWPLHPGRKILLSLHRYIGLVLAPLLVVIGLTGSISVFRVELDRALNSDLFTTRNHDSHLSLSDLIARLAQQHPDQPVVALEYRPASHDTIHAYLTPRRNRAGGAIPDEIFLDPFDGHELGGRPSEGCCLGRRALLPFIYRVHYSLAAGQTGLWILGVAALVWSLDCLNGLILTLPPVIPPWRRTFWRGWRTSWQIGRPRNALRLFFDLHRALGLWLWLILLGMTISGVALALGPQLFQPVIRHVFPMAAPPPTLPLPGGPHRLTLEEAEARAYALVSSRGITAHPAALILTHRPDTALFYLFSETGRFPAGFGTPLVTIDLETGEATQTTIPPQGRLGDIILQVQDPFHSGRLAGLAGRILVCASGIITALLSITGVLIWQRKRQAHRRAMRKAERRRKTWTDTGFKTAFDCFSLGRAKATVTAGAAFCLLRRSRTLEIGRKKGTTARVSLCSQVREIRTCQGSQAWRPVMPEQIPPQSQSHQPGVEKDMRPLALHIRESYRGSGKLAGKKALISGGDSGIGRAAALHFAREGADVAILYLEEHEDAQETAKLIEQEGVKALVITGDVRSSSVCNDAVKQVVEAFGGLDILVNNAGWQVVNEDSVTITDDEWQRHMDTNINGYFYLTRAALPHLKKGNAIVNTSSINAYRGSAGLLAYSTTKAAEMGFTRALALELVSKGIRVNAVAPGPVWTPLQPASWGPVDPEQVSGLASSVPMDRCGDPAELGPAYVYLASEDSSFVTGQTLHVNGGTIING